MWCQRAVQRAKEAAFALKRLHLLQQTQMMQRMIFWDSVQLAVVLLLHTTFQCAKRGKKGGRRAKTEPAMDGRGILMSHGCAGSKWLILWTIFCSQCLSIDICIDEYSEC